MFGAIWSQVAQIIYLKARHGGDETLAQQILKAKTPKQAKDMAYPPPTASRPLRDNDTPGQLEWSRQQKDAWNNGEDVKAFRRVLEAKYAKPELLQKLLSTGDAKLEERDRGGPKSVWGTGSDQPGGKGQNRHGKMLMDIRARASARSGSASTHSES